MNTMGNDRPTMPTWQRYALLALGATAQLFAIGGRFGLAAAAWIFPVLLLRFTRTGPAWSGALWIWLAHTAAAAFWLYASALGGSVVTLAGAVALAALLTLPFLLDALVRQDPEGVSAAFDHQGHVLATTDYFTTGQQTTVAYVPVRGVTTLYDRIGDSFARLCLAAVGAFLVTGLCAPGRRRAES